VDPKNRPVEAAGRTCHLRHHCPRSLHLPYGRFSTTPPDHDLRARPPATYTTPHFGPRRGRSRRPKRTAAADLDRLPLPCCDQPVHGAAAHPEHVDRLGGGGHERFHDHVPFLPGPVPPQPRIRISISASVAKQGSALVHVLRQQTLPRSARWWEVVSPAWSFWRWILWAGDLKGLE
jgi:hypothetical protein